MATLILFTTRVPHPLTDELIAAGFHVLEALAISEVIALAEEQTHAQVIVEADVAPERAKVIQQHYPDGSSEGECCPNDILWELELLFPRGSKLTQ